ncbi:uncharacterized protein LOC143195396 [Rhynchophorus ferrugineus]|uniref:uncharacterized protein LOC143195396 n=1 Tax=Rhynchophorus ferrugineus TaxID=354439 RepID=UPI003FCD6878
MCTVFMVFVIMLWDSPFFFGGRGGAALMVSVQFEGNQLRANQPKKIVVESSGRVEIHDVLSHEQVLPHHRLERVMGDDRNEIQTIFHPRLFKAVFILALL